MSKQIIPNTEVREKLTASLEALIVSFEFSYLSPLSFGELKEIKTRQEGHPVCAIVCPLMHCDVQVGRKYRNSVCPLLYHQVASNYRNIALL